MKYAMTAAAALLMGVALVTTANATGTMSRSTATPTMSQKAQLHQAATPRHHRIMRQAQRHTRTKLAMHRTHKRTQTALNRHSHPATSTTSGVGSSTPPMQGSSNLSIPPTQPTPSAGGNTTTQGTQQ